MSDIKPTTSQWAKRPRPGSPLKFANPKMSYAETQDRLAKAIGTQDRDLLGTFINQVVAVGDLGQPSSDLEVNFSVSAIEDILSNQSNGGVAKAMLAAQYTAVHTMIMTLARRFTRIVAEPEQLEIIVRLVASLARTSVAQYEALNRVLAGVTVGHVSVNEGGQAIVGSVTHNQGDAATQENPALQPLLTDAKTVPMPIIEEREERVPAPVSRTEESNR
jgi:hypothetical protein